MRMAKEQVTGVVRPGENTLAGAHRPGDRKNRTLRFGAPHLVVHTGYRWRENRPGDGLALGWWGWWSSSKQRNIADPMFRPG